MSLLFSARRVAQKLAGTTASYTSRAHPQPTPQYPVGLAIEKVLADIQERKDKREEKWERNAPKRRAKGLEDDGPYRNQNETVELALNLNVDPRKPGQALRGALSLPHGSGKTVRCVVFSRDEAACKEALEAGALHAGGEELIQEIVNGTIPLDFDRALATSDIQPVLAQKLARSLGPRGLMPNAKVGTLVPNASKLLPTLKEQLAGQVQYRTDKAGIIHMGVGKGSFSADELLDNLRTAFTELYDVKPETFGKGKKGKSGGSSKNAKYFLTAHVTSQQGKSFRLDLRTVDPTSPFFMQHDSIE